jgi:hypothetical protein
VHFIWGGRKPVHRPWHAKKTKKKMVLGDDVGLEDTVTLALCTLVDRLSYRHLCRTDIAKWVKASWQPLLGYILEFSFLTTGWMSFCFRTPEDSKLILDRLWLPDVGVLALILSRITSA